MTKTQLVEILGKDIYYLEYRSTATECIECRQEVWKFAYEIIGPQKVIGLNVESRAIIIVTPHKFILPKDVFTSKEKAIKEAVKRNRKLQASKQTSQDF